MHLSQLPKVNNKYARLSNDTVSLFLGLLGFSRDNVLIMLYNTQLSYSTCSCEV